MHVCLSDANKGYITWLIRSIALIKVEYIVASGSVELFLNVWLDWIRNGAVGSDVFMTDGGRCRWISGTSLRWAEHSSDKRRKQDEHSTTFETCSQPLLWRFYRYSLLLLSARKFHSFFQSSILSISIAPLQLQYYCEALSTTALILCWS